MRIKFLCIIICLFVNALVFASATNHTITGVVISGEDNEPLIGASVYVHADDLKKAGVSQTSLGTITDIDGKFSISVPEKVTRIPSTNRTNRRRSRHNNFRCTRSSGTYPYSGNGFFKWNPGPVMGIRRYALRRNRYS